MRVLKSTLFFHSWHTEDKGYRYGDPTIYQNGKLYKDLKKQYGPDINLNFILNFMRKHREEPMFVYYPFRVATLADGSNPNI